MTASLKSKIALHKDVGLSRLSFSERRDFLCTDRVYPNNTHEKSPIRVGFGILECARIPTDPNGTLCYKGVDFLKIGYIRVSTQEQNTIRQEAMMETLGVESVFVDRMSGKNTERPELKKMMQFVRQGDTVIVESISRFARNTKDLLELVEQLSAKGVQFISQKEAIDTSTPAGKFMLTVFAAVAELERSYLLERQREGVAQAKIQGKYAGRKPKVYPTADRIVEKWRRGEMTAVAAMKEIGISKSTFYRLVKKI